VSDGEHNRQAPIRVAAGLPPDIDQRAYRLWVAAFGAVAIVFLVIMAVPALRDAVMPIDEWFWRSAVDSEMAALVGGAEALALIGGTAMMVLLALVGALVFIWQRRWLVLGMWLATFWLGTSVNATIKALYERPRPPLPLAQESSWSFASGHALSAALVALLVVLLAVPSGPARRLLLVVGGVYAIVMAASRVYLRVHWLTDVIAGLAIGGAVTLAVLLLTRWWQVRAAAGAESA
jgi:undecaprenyl-diphosphatase